MYENFFGFKEKPFNLTPDPKFVYFSEMYKEAFAHLRYAIKEGKLFHRYYRRSRYGENNSCTYTIK